MSTPSSLKCIGAGAFAKCKWLRKVTLNEGLEVLPEEAFSKSAVEEIALPTTMKTLGCMAFAYCKNLKNIVLPEGLTELEQSCF